MALSDAFNKVTIQQGANVFRMGLVAYKVGRIGYDTYEESGHFIDADPNGGLRVGHKGERLIGDTLDAAPALAVNGFRLFSAYFGSGAAAATATTTTTGAAFTSGELVTGSTTLLSSETVLGGTTALGTETVLGSTTALASTETVLGSTTLLSSETVLSPGSAFMGT